MLSIPQAKRCFELTPCSELRLDLRWRLNNQQQANNQTVSVNQLTPPTSLPVLTIKVEPRENVPVVADWFGFVTNTDVQQAANNSNNNHEDSAATSGGNSISTNHNNNNNSVMTFRIGCTNHSSSTCLFSPSGCFVTVEGPAQLVQRSIHVFNFIDVDRHQKLSSSSSTSSSLMNTQHSSSSNTMLLPQWPIWRKQALHLHELLQTQRLAAMQRAHVTSYDDIEARIGPRIMVCSSRSGSGKTSICKMLLNLAVRDGFQPLFVSADPRGTSLVGQPGCFAAFYADNGLDATENAPTNGSANFYPCVQVLVPVDGCMRAKRAESWAFALEALMSRQAEKRTFKVTSCAAGGVIVDTETVDEFLSGDDLDKLVAVIDQCNIQYVVVVGSENLRNSLRLKLSGLLKDVSNESGNSSNNHQQQQQQPFDDGISPIVVINNNNNNSSNTRNENDEKKRREKERALQNLMMSLNNNNNNSGNNFITHNNNNSDSTSSSAFMALDPDALLLQEQMKRFSQVPTLNSQQNNLANQNTKNSSSAINNQLLDICDVIKNESSPKSILRQQRREFKNGNINISKKENSFDADDDDEEEEDAIRVSLINFPVVDGAEDTSSFTATSWVFSPLLDGNNPHLTATNRNLPNHQPQLQIPAITSSWSTYFFGTATSPLSAYSILKVPVSFNSNNNNNISNGVAAITLAEKSENFSFSSKSNFLAPKWCSMKAETSSSGGGLMPLLDSGTEQISNFRSVAEPIDIIAKFEQFRTDFNASKSKNINKGGKNQRPMMMAALIRVDEAKLASSSSSSSFGKNNKNAKNTINLSNLFDAAVGGEVMGFVGVVNAGTIAGVNAGDVNQQFVDILSPMKSLPTKESFVFALLHGDWQP